MDGGSGGGRENQKRRTRKDLLAAAARLMKEGRKPSLEEVAAAAMVSRATAYRFFPSVEALVAEASAHIAMPEPEALVAGDAGEDVVARVQLVDDVVHQVVAENEGALRLMLVHTLQQGLSGGPESAIRRQNRRTPLLEAALAPANLPPPVRDRLVAALGLIVGPESMVVFKDVLQLDDAAARAVKRWAIRALVEAAQAQPHAAEGEGAS
jgi:AcrR family transcriptional regulator